MQEPKISPFCPLQKWMLKVPCLESHGHMDPEVEGASLQHKWRPGMECRWAACWGLPFLTPHRREQEEGKGWDLPQASIAQGLPTSGGLCPGLLPDSTLTHGYHGS